MARKNGVGQRLHGSGFCKYLPTVSLYLLCPCYLDSITIRENNYFESKGMTSPCFSIYLKKSNGFGLITSREERKIRSKLSKDIIYFDEMQSFVQKKTSEFLGYPFPLHT